MKKYSVLINITIYEKNITILVFETDNTLYLLYNQNRSSLLV